MSLERWRFLSGSCIAALLLRQAIGLDLPARSVALAHSLTAPESDET